MSAYGSLDAVRHEDGRVEVVRADHRIAVSRDLLADHNESLEVTDGGYRVVFCGTHAYVATGEHTRHGDPIYEADRTDPTGTAVGREGSE